MIFLVYRKFGLFYTDLSISKFLFLQISNNSVKTQNRKQIMQRKEINMKKIYRKIYLRLTYPSRRGKIQEWWNTMQHGRQ